MKRNVEQDVKGTFINVALKLFAEKGYFNTSIDEIVEMAGFSKGLLFYHFKSKENLLSEILNFEKGQALSIFNQDYSHLQDKELLLILMERYFDSLVSQRDFWMLYIQIILNMELRAKMNTHLNELKVIYFERMESLLHSRTDKLLNDKAESIDLMKNGILLRFLIDNDTTQLTLMKHGLIKVLS